MHLPLMPFKAEAPLPSPFMVDRDEIGDRVFSASGVRLILVRGPAGFGKTTVLLQLKRRLMREAVPCAWLNIDSADSDLPRFLQYVEAVLDPLLGDQDPIASGGEPRDLSVQLLERIASHGKRFALFLDECEHIRSHSVTAFVTQLIDSLPAGAVLVVGTRGIPSIGIARLRARGQLLEIDPAQLRFTETEAAEFLSRRRGLSLSEEQIRYLHTTTEGWVAALWLASIALESRADADQVIAGVTGSNAAIADYLAEEVLARQDESVREFLLKTSLLDQLSVPLCNAVCGRSDSVDLLQRIERANLFLVPLDEQRSSYRYHGIFTEFLRARLRIRKPEWEAEVCRAAAHWFMSQNRMIPAVDYLLRAGDTAPAISLIEQQADGLRRKGRLRLLAHWLDAVPASALDSRPRLKLSHAWSVTLTRGAPEALPMARVMETQTLNDAKAQTELAALQPLLLGMSDQVEQAHDMALLRLPKMESDAAFARAMLLQTLANTSMILGQFRAASEYADQARQTHGSETSEFSLTLADAVDGSINLMQGRLRQATVLLQRSGLPKKDGQSASRNAFVGVLLAEALYESGDEIRAERLLRLYLPYTQELCLPDQLILAHTTLGKILEARGEADAALQLLGELEQIGLRQALPRVVASARIERARHFLNRANTAAAHDQLNRSGDERIWHMIGTRSYVANDIINRPMIELRDLIANGGGDQAVSLARELLEKAEHAQLHRRAIKLRILMAHAMCRDGQRRAAMRTIERAMTSAADEGFVSTFIEEGAVVQGMVSELLEARGIEASKSLNDALLNRMTRSEMLQDQTAAVQRQAGKVDALTKKEIQVLEMLAQGFSNKAIADRLFISESTARTHLRSINSKLHTSSRTQALVAARALGLLPN